MKIYVINLDRDRERMEWMRAQFQQRELQYERFSALTPETIPTHISSRFLECATDILLPGNIACFSSHLAVAERLLASREEYCLVLEDDVEIVCSGEELRAIATKCARFHMLKLNDFAKSPTLEIGTASRFSIVRYQQVPRGTGAYFLSRQGAEIFLNRAVKLAISTDNFIRAEAYLHLDIAGIMPPPIPQDRFGTSSLDPKKQRNKARTKRYFYMGSNAFIRFLMRPFSIIKYIGLHNYIRLNVSQIRMKLNGIKRDLNLQYIIRTGHR